MTFHFLCLMTPNNWNSAKRRMKGEAYEVEFVTLGGTTAAVLELESYQVRVAVEREIPHARLLSAA